MVGWRNRLAGLTASTCVRTWMSTLNYQALFSDPTVNPADPRFRGPIIAIFWHEALLVPFYLQGNSHTAILTSRHRDGEWVSATARFLGFHSVRGSTFRGGSRAVLELLRSLRGYNVGIACDGPRGPRRHLAPGPIYLSSRLQIPIVPYGIGFQRAWRLGAWDRFAIPLPYSDVKLILGPRIQIPREMTLNDIERYRREVQTCLRRLTRRAELWARRGGYYAQQQCLRRRPMPAPVRRLLRCA